MRKIKIETTAPSQVHPAVTAASRARGGSESPNPSENEEVSYGEAKRRADERAAAALQCSIDNKDACVMCSG